MLYVYQVYVSECRYVPWIILPSVRLYISRTFRAAPCITMAVVRIS